MHEVGEPEDAQQHWPNPAPCAAQCVQDSLMHAGIIQSMCMAYKLACPNLKH